MTSEDKLRLKHEINLLVKSVLFNIHQKSLLSIGLYKQTAAKHQWGLFNTSSMKQKFSSSDDSFVILLQGLEICYVIFL